MRNYLPLFALVFAAFTARSQSLTMSVTPSVCFNSASPASNTVAANVTTTLTGVTNYTWYVYTYSSSCAGTYTATNSSGTNVVISFPCCGTYTVACAAYNGTANVGFTYTTVAVNCNNIYLYSPTNFASCGGSPVSIYAYGGNSYTWTNGTNTVSSTYSISLSPTVNTCYTVAATSTVGCVFTSVACVTVSSSPTLNVTGVSSNTNNCFYNS